MSNIIFANNLEIDITIQQEWLDIVNVVRNDAYYYLSSFLNDAAYTDKLQTAFGTSFNGEVANQLFDGFAKGNFTTIPTIEIVNRNDINGANGAFAIATGKIYLAADFISQNAQNLDAIVAVLLEETGHYIDAKINVADAAGDEGDIFARLVQGKSRNQQELAVLRAEDDTATVTLDGQLVEIEQNIYNGGAGDDTLIGAAGSDILNGNDGNDILDPGFFSSGSTDTVDGGAGNDVIRVNYTSKNDGAGIHVRYLSNNIFNRANGNQPIVTISNVENYDITGTQYNDAFEANSGNDTYRGGAGSDELKGGAGNDILNPGYSQYSTDTVDGGEGDDLLQVDYSSKNNGVGIHLGYNNTDVIYHRAGTVGDNFELVKFSNIERFEITGTQYADAFEGRTGNDIFNGGAGSDELKGGAGNDILNPGYSQGSTDTVDGGAGDDLLQVDYSSKNNDYGIHLGFGNTDKIYSRGGAGDNYELVKFSNIERFDITGTQYADVFEGRDGNDIFRGSAGDDILNGGTGNDTLTGGGGKDTLTGGTGSDRFDYRNLADSVFNSFDVITDFNATAGNDLFLVSTARSGFSNAGSVATLDATGIAAKLTTTNFASNSAAQFTFASRTFVAINDATAGFSANSDAIIEVTGLSGTLGIGNFVNDVAVLPSITLAVSPASVLEDGTANLIYTFTRTEATTNLLSVNYAIAGTADSSDYTGATPGTGKTITFAAGASTATLTIDPTADTTFESNETVALTLASGAGYTVGTTTVVTGTITNDEYIVGGYIGSWNVDSSTSASTPFNKLTHLFYSFADVSTDGTVKLPEQDLVDINKLKQIKAQNPNLKIMLSIGGAGNEVNKVADYFSAAAATMQSRANFAQSAIQLMKTNGFDGIDIDWEFPKAVEDGNYIQLLAQLRQQVNQASQNDGKQYLLTTAFSGSPYVLSASDYGASPYDFSAQDLKATSDYVDFINVMTYDYHGTGEFTTNHQAALYKSTNDTTYNATKLNTDWAIQHYLSAGVPAKDIVLGAPLYGRSWTGVNAGTNNDSLFKSGTTGTAPTYTPTYKELHAQLGTNGYQSFWDNSAKVPYTYSSQTQVFSTYEDKMSIGAKTDYVKQQGIGGAFFWEITGDLPLDNPDSLISAAATNLGY